MSAIDWKATLESCGEACERMASEKPATHLTFGWTPKSAAAQDITIQVASHVRFAFTHWQRVNIKKVTVHP